MPLSLDQDWWTLLRSIQKGQCILLLGPGVASDPADPAGDPLSVRLAHKLTEKLKQEGKGDQVIAPLYLAHVAQTYQRTIAEAHPGLPLTDSTFHCIDLTASGGIHALAQTILEDWDRAVPS
jgi:hypothetical protein